MYARRDSLNLSQNVPFEISETTKISTGNIAANESEYLSLPAVLTSINRIIPVSNNKPASMACVEGGMCADDLLLSQRNTASEVRVNTKTSIMGRRDVHQ
jgi:hypothetical protein